MSFTNYLRLFVLCMWLLDGDVNCENTQEGFVLRVQAGQATVGVHNDDGDHKRWSEPLGLFRMPTTGYETSSVDGEQSGNVYPAREDHTTDSKSSQIQSRYLNPVIPETRGRVDHFKSGFSSASLTRARSAVVDNRSGKKALAFPNVKKIHQADSGSVFSTGAVQASPRIYRTRTKLTGGFSPVQVDRATLGFVQNDRKPLIYAHGSIGSPNIQDIKSSLKPESHKIPINPSRPHPLHLQESRLTTRPELSEYHPAYVFPNSYKHARAKILPKGLTPINKKTHSVVKGHSAAEKADAKMSYPTWRPRFFSSEVMPEARGYAHVRHIKPGFDKTQPQASSAAGKRFLETGFLSIQQSQGSYSFDSTKQGNGVGVSALSERQQNLYSSRGSQHGSWHHPPTDRGQISVQGKFKPFQRLPTNHDLPAHTNSSDGEAPSSQTSAGTTLPPTSNSTGITSSVAPSVHRELSTESASSTTTEGADAELIPQASSREGQSESSAEVEDSLEQNRPFTVSPSTLKPAEEEGKGDGDVSSPLGKDQSEV